MLRYLYADTSPVPAVGPMEDSAAQDWWGGAQRCMVGVAIATAATASVLSAQIAQQVTNGAQDDPQLAAPLVIHVDEDAPLVLPRNVDWPDIVVSLWWDDSGPIEHVPTQEEVPPVFPAPNLWSNPRLLLWPTEEAVTPPPPLQVVESDWVNPVPPALWVLPPPRLVPNFQDEWVPPVFPLPPDEDFWNVPRPAWPWAPSTLYAFWQDERPTPPVPLGVDEGEWRSGVTPQLWPVPPQGLVFGWQDERPTPIALPIDEGEFLFPVVRPQLWLLPPIGLVTVQSDEWVPPAPPPTLHGLRVVNHSRERYRIVNHSFTRLRIVPHLKQGGRPVQGVLNPYADLELDFEVFDKASSDGHWEDTVGLTATAFLSLTPTGVAIGAATVALGARTGDPNDYFGVIDSAVLQTALLPTYANTNIYLIFLIAGDDRRRMALRVGGVGDFDV